MLDKFQAKLLVERIVISYPYRDLAHILALERHPCRSVRLLKMPSAREGRTPIKDPNVVQSQESAFKDVLAKTVFAIDPPCEIDDELMKDPLEKFAIAHTIFSLLQIMQKDGRPGVHRWINIAEIPFVGRHLAIGMKIESAYHQFELLFGKLRVYQRKRQCMKGQVPCGIPGVLPFVRHRDDVVIEHVEPLFVA